MEDTPNLYNFLYPEYDHTWTKEEFLAYEEAVDAWNWEKFRREVASRVVIDCYNYYKQFTQKNEEPYTMDEKVKDSAKLSIKIAGALIEELKNTR